MYVHTKLEKDGQQGWLGVRETKLGGRSSQLVDWGWINPPPSVKRCKFFSKKGSECSETKEYAKYVKILQGTCVLSR